MKITKTRKIGPYVVLLICLSLTGLVWLLLNNFNRMLAQQRFQDRTNQIVTALTKRMEDYATVIRGGAAFFTATGEVTRTEWRTYVEHLDISDTFPGVQGIGFSRVIQPSELAQHIQQIRAEGFPDYTVRPEGERGVYTSIIFLEPFDARNQRAFGYDMFSEPVRRTAMEKARDTDAPSISGKVKLVQETEQDIQAGFLMYVPVYLHGMPTDSVEERRAAHQGYVYSPFRIKDLIQDIFQEPLDDIDFEVFDGVEVSLATLMYDSDESGRGLDEESDPKFSSYQTIDLYGHQWTLYFATRPSFEAISARYESWSVLIAGMIISLLAFIYTKGQETTRERALAMAYDMTSELRRREDELKDSEAMWHGLVNANPESVYLTNTAGVILAANEVFAQRLGRDHQELIGANLFDLLPPEVTIERKKFMDKVNVSGQPIRFEDNRAGRFIDNYIHPIFNSDGKLTQLAFLGIDITEHRKTLKEIKEYAEQYQAILSAELYGFWLADKKGKLLDVNDAYCKLSGYTRDELLKLSISDLETIEKPEDTARHIRKIIETGKDRFESKHKAKDGRVFDVEISTSFLPSRQEFIVFISDITDRKQAEEELRSLNAELEQRVIERTAELSKLSHAVEQSPVSIVITDTAGLIEYVNPRFTMVTGYTFEEAIGKNPRILKSGDTSAEEYKQMWETITAGCEWRGEFHNKKKNSELYWESASISPITNADGIITHFIAVKEDITERKRAEAEILKLNAELEQHAVQLEAARDEAERANRAKSEFLSRMSHELRTPLNSILGFSQLMEMDKLTPDQMVGVDQILKSGRHLLDLINEVLDISRIEAGRLELSPETVNVEEAILQTVDLIRPLADQRHITIRVKVPSSPQDVFVTADRKRLKQVLLNLLSNAVKYNREQGEIRINTSLLVDGYLHLQVQDTGPGIVPENLEPLFNPFERIGAEQTETKGTGLGLAIAKKLVEAMGGRIGVESTIGQGSTFWLDLKLTTQPEVSLVMAEMDNFLKTNPNHVAGTILYVEDNLSNITLVEKIVTRLPGVELISTVQGRMAMDLARQHKPRLILLDLNLPDVNGSQVLEWLRANAETKDIPVVVMSADAMPTQIEHLLAIGAQAYLTKPIDVKEFLKMLDEMLGRGDGKK